MKAPLEGLSSPEASAAEEVAEKVLSFVGRAFRHDIMSALSSGVLTPEGLKEHFSATTEAVGNKAGNHKKAPAGAALRAHAHECSPLLASGLRRLTLVK